MLGHGAGGGPHAADLQAVASVATELGLTVALVEQPYRVAGRRAPPRAPQLDAAWLAVVEALAHPGPLVVGGRSSGARVACRTASAAGAAAVLCLAFPLHPPSRAADPAAARLPELEGVRVPVLVVQGERDRFGVPPRAPGREVVLVPGDHSLRRVAPVREAVAAWLATIMG
jgi:predicted alpha/beta-hydrolase family hydrolase